MCFTNPMYSSCLAYFNFFFVGFCNKNFLQISVRNRRKKRYFSFFDARFKFEYSPFQILAKELIYSPSSMAVDEGKGNRIYWADPKFRRVYSILPDG